MTDVTRRDLTLIQTKRFRLRTLCSLTALIAVCIAIPSASLQRHRHISRSERKALDRTVLDIAGYDEKCVLPRWLASCLPNQISSDFTHVVYLDLTLSPLSGYTADELRQLLRCEFVETIRIYNPTLTGEMRDVLLEFPNLKRIEMLAYHDAVDSHQCDLRRDPLPGIEVVVE